jgi:hypothetical protein
MNLAAGVDVEEEKFEVDEEVEPELEPGKRRSARR